MPKSPGRQDAAERSAGGGGTEPPPAPTSLVLVGSLEKADGEQELVRVTARVDAPLDATCIRRVRKLLEALSRTILSRDRRRWDRIDEARELLVLGEEPDATAARTDASEAQTEKRLRVPSDGAPSSVGLRPAHAPATDAASEAGDRSEAPTRRVRIGATRDAGAEASARSGDEPAERRVELPAPLPPPAPRPSPWVTVTASAPSAHAPPAPPPPLTPHERGGPMPLGSAPEPRGGAVRPPSAPRIPLANAGAPGPPGDGLPREANEPHGPPRSTVGFEDAHLFTLAASGPAPSASPLPFRQPLAEPSEPGQTRTPAGAPRPPAGPGSLASGPAAAPANDDSEPPTITVDSMPRPRDRPSAPRSTARERRSEPIEETLARLARAAGEAIAPRAGPSAPRAAPATPSHDPASPPPASPSAPAPGPAAEREGQEGATIAAPGLGADDSMEALPNPLADMTVEHYALLCAETALRPAERESIHRRHGILGERQRALLDRRWQARLAADETLAQQWRWYYARHEQSLQR